MQVLCAPTPHQRAVVTLLILFFPVDRQRLGLFWLYFLVLVLGDFLGVMMIFSVYFCLGWIVVVVVFGGGFLFVSLFFSCALRVFF